MAQNSKIEWCHHTGNIWHGCTKVHEGCDNCYAETLAKRWKNDIWGNDKPRKEIRSFWKDLERYQQLAREANEMHRVFVGSMMDIFEKPMPLIDSKGNKLDYDTDYLRRQFFIEVVPNSPNLLFLLLTKRPSNINKYIPEEWKINPPSNVMFGVSPATQETANTLISQLMKVNGKRFLSIEPQLENIKLNEWLTENKKYNSYFYCECKKCQWKGSSEFAVNRGKTISCNHCDEEVIIHSTPLLHWIIQGGESGHHKRPFDTDWARYTKEECRLSQTPYFFKQIDKIQSLPEDLIIREFPLINIK